MTQDETPTQAWADYFHLNAGCDYGHSIHDCECFRHPGDKQIADDVVRKEVTDEQRECHALTMKWISETRPLVAGA